MLLSIQFDEKIFRIDFRFVFELENLLKNNK
jgi:hypothetical protein